MTIFLLLFSCNSDDFSERYRLNKKIWNITDYENVIRKIKYTNKDEKKPHYEHPKKAIVFQKLVDKNNVAVVVEDEELGLKHRSEFGTEMFKQYRDLVGIYSDLDREDQYVYPLELVDILKFGLYLQLYYFDLGNQEIIQNADNPNSAGVQRVVKSNERTLIGNYCVYLGYVKKENSFTDQALNNYIDGIDEYFPTVIEKFPDANFNEMIKKTKDMLNRTESERVKSSLKNILSKLVDSHPDKTSNSTTGGGTAQSEA